MLLLLLLLYAPYHVHTGSAAGAAARAAAGAAAGAVASAAAVCTYYVIIGGALCTPVYVHDKVHTVAAEAAAAPAADPWIHGSISFILKHIFSDQHFRFF